MESGIRGQLGSLAVEEKVGELCTTSFLPVNGMWQGGERAVGRTLVWLAARVSTALLTFRWVLF